MDVHSYSDALSWPLLASLGLSLCSLRRLYFLSIWPYVAMWLTGQFNVNFWAEALRASVPSAMASYPTLALGWGWLGKSPQPACSEHGVWTRSDPLVFCDCYCTGTQPTLTNIHHKVLDSSWGRDGAQGPVSISMAVSKARPVLTCWVVSEEQTNLASCTRTASMGGIGLSL